MQQMFFQSKNIEILNLFLNSDNKSEIEEFKKLCHEHDYEASGNLYS